MNFSSETLIEEAQMGFAMGARTGLGKNRVSYVSRDDVAAAVAGALTTDNHHGAIYNLSGPVALSGEERVSILSEAAGKPLGYIMTSEAQLREGLAGAGLPGFVINAIASMQSSFVDGAYDIVTGDIEKLSGEPPRPLAAVAHAAFPARA